MPGELILVFILVRYLIKTLRDVAEATKWVSVLKWLQYIIPVLIIIEAVFLRGVIGRCVSHLILLAVIGGAYIVPGFRSVRTVIIAIVPFAIISFIKDITIFFQAGGSYTTNIYLNIIYYGTLLWMIVFFILFHKQRKALLKERQKREIEEEQNRIIVARKEELETMVAERTSKLIEQKDELEHALAELREMQAQLVQKEKMASLGELTAGIAHEIQNPLNFVNNFSEINKELLEELEQEIDNGNLDEVKAIATDLKENELKIHHHGKRADAIVKGMLQHSRASSGTKEPTDINALADEYLRLSYHGLRAKDKSFNATFKTDFDESIGKLNVVPQDMGRVLLNLFNNAFYAVAEKKKQQPQGYEPTVSVSTKVVMPGMTDGKVRICVRDNGLGIPQQVFDKIYQPFFTTKPAGQGTGLGLSLSYEIIKAHGGELKVETAEGAFAEFMIDLPCANR